MEDYSQVVLFTLIPSAALLTGGGIAIIKKPSANVRSAVLHFAAGVIFSVVGVELMPDIMAKHDTWKIALGFGAGALLMLAIRYFLDPGKEQKNSSFPVVFIAVIGIDLLIDGILMGIGFVTSRQMGMSLAIGLSVELFSLGMAVATTLSASRVSRIKTVLSIFGLAFIILGSALLSAALLAGMTAAYLEVFLSFGLAALLFLITEELLVEAHESNEGPWLTAAFFAGFLLFMLLPVG